MDKGPHPWLGRRAMEARLVAHFRPGLFALLGSLEQKVCTRRQYY